MAHWEPIAVQHASTVANYLKVHAESAEFLTKDPMKRDRILKQLSNSNAPWVRKELKYDANEDVDELLRGWDAAISKTPCSFEDHFYRLHYATSAMSYYQRDKVSPDVRKYGEKFRCFLEDKVDLEFDAFLETIIDNYENVPRNAPAPAPPSNIPYLTADVIKVLLGTPSVLFATRFYHRGDGDDDDAASGYWAVKKINRSETATGTSIEYAVSFEDDMVFDLEEKALVDLMLASCAVPG